ncbi:MAG: diguanylate cyclase [Candidatus Atribacteria bacterium]|nr:diguanylate cyclase [Candidatus Atribacteria bacterium]
MSGRQDPDRHKAHILVVEDSSTQAEQLQHLLVQDGYQVSLAKDGRQALTCLERCTPALVISDISMPEMNGYELCKHLKADECTHDIPVILLTSLSNPEDILEGLACDADNFITKPYSEDYLLAHVQQVLANRKLSQSENVRVGMEVVVAGRTHFISAASQQMLSLLLSTYEAAVQRNRELVQTQEELRSLNEHLEEKTRELAAEIVEREHLQAELRELSLHDELTGLLNQRGFMSLAEQHSRLAVRNRQAFVILVLELGGRRQIKDSFGHAAGDQALQVVARAMEQAFRASDILAHLGGDEFIALLPGCDQASSRTAITHFMDKLNIAKDDTTSLVPLSMRIGLAQFDPARPVSVNDLLEGADADLGDHKRHFNGRRER